MRPGLLRLGKPDGSGSDESSRDQILGYVEGRISQMTLVWASDLRRNQPYADEKSSKQEKRRSPSSAGGTFLQGNGPASCRPGAQMGSAR